MPVLFYHAGFSGFSGGFVGVDVFFVISGYLITTIILSERRAGRFSFWRFYSRRILRIFPALFVMMAVSYPVALGLLGPAAMTEFAGSVAASTVFVANFYFLEVSGYFATAAELKPLLHNWSLAVEEQFYLIFPMVVLLTWRAGAKGQVALLGTVALVSLGAAEWYVRQGEAARAFFLLHTRFWELLAGCLTAYWLASRRGQDLRAGGRLRHAAVVGLALILTAVFAYDDETAFPGLAALLPCLGAVLVVGFATPQGLAGRVLGWRPAVFVGLVSYSLYLWHVPLFVFARIGTGRDDAALFLALCVVAFGAACLSWRYVERPVRQMRDAPLPRLFGAAALAMGLLGGLGLAGVQTEGFRALYISYRLDAATRANFKRYQPQTKAAGVEDADCGFAAQQLDAAFVARFQACARHHGKAVLVLGDSHAANVFGALRSTGRMPFLVALSRGGCRPFRPRPECPYEPVIAFLEAHGASVGQLVFHVSGSHYILDHRGEADKDAAFVVGNATRIATQSIRKTADYLARLPQGPDIVWLGPFAEARVDLEAPENYSPARLRFNPVSLDLFDRLDRALKAVPGSGFRYISLIDVLQFNSETLLQGGCITFSDQDHLSHCGERLVGPDIAAAVARDWPRAKAAQP